MCARPAFVKVKLHWWTAARLGRYRSPPPALFLFAGQGRIHVGGIKQDTTIAIRNVPRAAFPHFRAFQGVVVGIDHQLPAAAWTYKRLVGRAHAINLRTLEVD